MPSFQRLQVGLSAARQMGFKPLFYLARYRLGLRSGWIARKVEAACRQAANWNSSAPHNVSAFKSAQSSLQPFLQADIKNILQQSAEIRAGKIRLFGGSPVELSFTAPANLPTWEKYETGRAAFPLEDAKFTWEPARFGFFFSLLRAYYLTGDDRLPGVFWIFFEQFSQFNPPLQGPNWVSAQEVALRLIAFCWAGWMFQNSSESTEQRLTGLYQSIAVHAARIPPTLDYARAQGNNHLLSEAAGLYTASAFLPDHPASNEWCALGWKTFHQGLADQITPDGTYAQHSANYHRLMLDLSLWMLTVSRLVGDTFPTSSLERLVAATSWLYDLADPQSGQVPNLGSNDGAQFLPLSACSFSDVRPTLQTCSRAFLGCPAFPPGPWDELSVWLNIPVDDVEVFSPPPSSAIHKIKNEQVWGSVRIARFTSRPNHADQLHVDLWWDGEPLCLDAGTYRYSAPQPWNNPLSGTLCHNTISIDGLDQMRRAGKFLWLDWAQAYTLPGNDPKSIIAETNAWRNLNILHHRSLTSLKPLEWLVVDELLPLKSEQTSHTIILHWLLPDVPWLFENGRLILQQDRGEMSLCLQPPSGVDPIFQLIQAGKLLFGEGEYPPYLGWSSPTYNFKIPALSFRMIFVGVAPLKMTSRWVINPQIR